MTGAAWVGRLEREELKKVQESVPRGSDHSCKVSDVYSKEAAELLEGYEQKKGTRVNHSHDPSEDAKEVLELKDDVIV